MRSRWRWLAPALAAAAILVGTSIPRLPMPGGSWDKAWHFGGYALLGLALGWSVGGPWRRLARAAVGIALFGALDELHQSWIPGRSTDPADWLADSAGGATGLALIAALTRRQESRS